MAQTSTSAALKNIVLVHGGFVDGSGWEDVYKTRRKGQLHGRSGSKSNHLVRR